MTSVLIASSIRIVLVALFAALLVRAFRIRHPATLHGLWFAVAAVMLVMPVIVQYSPRLTLPVLPAPSVMRPLLAGDATEPIAADRAAAVQGEPSATPSALPDVLTLVYLAGVVIFAARVAAGLAAVRRLRRTVTMEEGQFTHEACAAPITIGLIRPVTVLPRGWSAWPAARREAGLTHERARMHRHHRQEPVDPQPLGLGVAVGDAASAARRLQPFNRDRRFAGQAFAQGFAARVRRHRRHQDPARPRPGVQQGARGSHEVRARPIERGDVDRRPALEPRELGT
jgi:hypothetical protein